MKEHPDVFMPRKESHYFDRHFDNGLDWYQSFFDDYLGQPVIGEKTATYFHSNKATENILQTNPDMKVIICLRDPVERMFSHYSMMAKTDDFLRETGFIGSAKPGTDYVDWSQYAEQVKQYQKIIPEDNLKFILYEEKDVDPVRFIQDLYEFIGVDPKYVPDSAKLRTKQGQFEHNHWFWGPVSKFLLHPRAPTSFRKLYTDLRPQAISDIEDSTYESLSPYFDDILDLECLLGRNLDCWRTKQYIKQ